MRRGAYVATPAADPTVPDIPTGWSELWADSFPDALPPGYVPVYDLDFIDPTPENMKYDDDITLRVVYTDKYDWPGMPYSSETIDIEVYLAGVLIYSGSTTNAYIAGGYYGAEFSLNGETDLGLTTDNNGDTLTVTATGKCRGQSCQDSTDIDVGQVYAEFKIAMSGTGWPAPGAPYDAYTWYSILYLHKSTGLYDTPYAYMYAQKNQIFSPAAWDYSHDVDTVDDMALHVPADADDGSAYIGGQSGADGLYWIKTLQLESGVTYNVGYWWGVELPDGYSMQFDYTLTIYNPDDTVKETYTKQIIKTGLQFSGTEWVDEELWATIDGDTGEVTIL